MLVRFSFLFFLGHTSSIIGGVGVEENATGVEEILFLFVNLFRALIRPGKKRFRTLGG
jgi:hypothetical protein